METTNKSKYDLEERTFNFAKNVRSFVHKLSRTLNNIQDVPQLIRSSGSIGANYIEANESISKKGFVHRIKISRKEAKESTYWLRLIECYDKPDLELIRNQLINESVELTKIFSAIMRKFH